MFESSIGIQLSVVNIVINLAAASLLGLVIKWVYKRIYTGFSYSHQFASTLLLITIIASIVMMVIGNNLARAFGLVGAFAIIRFRTVVKEIRDMTFIFLSIVIGMAAGSNSYLLGALGAVVVLAFAWVTSKKKGVSVTGTWYSLSFRTKSEKTHTKVRNALEDYTQEYTLSSITSEAKVLRTYVYQVRFVDENMFDDFSRRLSELRPLDALSVTKLSSDLFY